MNRKINLEMSDIQTTLQQIDYDLALRVLGYALTFYASRKTFDAYNLHKKSKPPKISKISLPPEVTNKNKIVDFEKIISKKLGSDVEYFAKKLLTTFDYNDLTCFYNNINELNIIIKQKKINTNSKGQRTLAYYKFKNNSITIKNEKFNYTIFHELFHMASTKYEKEVVYTGFSQNLLKKNLRIANSLNEGYTQLLTERYFGDIEGVKGKSYSLEKQYAGILESVVGKKKMERLYLNANLPGLIDELKQYATEEEIIQFITDVDFIGTNLNDKRDSLYKKKLLTKSLQRANSFLTTAYIKKQKQYVNAGIINEDELQEEIIRFVSSFNKRVTYGKKVYDAFPESVLMESMEKGLSTPSATTNKTK